jgi:hypothetical protein
MKLEGFSLHPAPFGGSGGAWRRLRAPCGPFSSGLANFFLDALWREREEKTTAKKSCFVTEEL